MNSSKGGIVLMLLSTFFFAFKPVLGRIAIEHGLLPGPLVTIRLMVALPFFLLTVALMRRGGEMKLTVKEFIATAAVSIFGLSGAMLFSFYSIQYLGASLSTLIIFVFPAITAVLAYFVHGEPITVLKRWSLSISFLGIILVVIPIAGAEMADILFFDPVKGIGFALLCAVCWSATQVSFQKLVEKNPPLIITTYSTGIMLVFFLAVNGLPSADISMEALISVILLGTVCWYIPFLLVIYAIKLIGASWSAIIQSLGPGLTVLIAWISLDERLAVLQMAGMILLIGAVFLTKKDSAMKKDATPALPLEAGPVPAPDRG